jgi:hypothetical protein
MEHVSATSTFISTYQHEAVWGQRRDHVDRATCENFHLFPGFGVGPVPLAFVGPAYQHEAVLVSVRTGRTLMISIFSLDVPVLPLSSSRLQLT